jgi:hypothetical protein
MCRPANRASALRDCRHRALTPSQV